MLIARAARETRIAKDMPMSDVHRADASIADAIATLDPRLVFDAKRVEADGRKFLRMAMIACMDGSSECLWQRR